MGKKIPLRQCVGCREMKTKKEMIRVIKTPENEVVLDAKGSRMAEVHIFVFLRSVFRKQDVQKDWNVL